MFEKIFIGIMCAASAVLFGIGALGLALEIGPIFWSLALAVTGGFGGLGFATLLGGD